MATVTATADPPTSPDPAAEPPARRRPRTWRRRAGLAAAGLASLYGLFSVTVGVGFAFKQALRRHRPVASQANHLAPRAQQVSFTSEDGYRLEGYLADPVGEAPVLVIQHGRGRNRDSYLPWAAVFARAGYGVLSFDWRGHGRSDGNVIQHGGGEPNDLVAALGFLESRPETAGRPVGVFGASLGGACVAMTGGRLPPRVKAMVLDSPYGDLGRMARQRLEDLGPLSAGPRLALDGVAWALFGRTATDIVPEREVQGFAPRPLYVIHGEHDEVIPHAEGRSLFEAYPGPKTFWSVEEPGHCKSRTQHTREFMRRLSSFYHQHLPGAPDPTEVLAHTPERLEKFGENGELAG